MVAAFSLYPHETERDRERERVKEKESTRVSLLTRALTPSVRASLSWPDPLKASPPNAITLGIKLSTYEFGGTHILLP